MLQEREENTSQ